MRIFTFLLSFFLFAPTMTAQKELWGINPGDQYNNPSLYFGNITKYDIYGENPVIVHEFDSIQGKIPKGKLLLASNGKLYGTCLNGGASGNPGTLDNSGVLFEYDLILGQYRVLNYFESAPFLATNPSTGVIEPIPGQLYGTANNRIYRYDIATETMTFFNPLPFNNRFAFELIKASDGNLYGTSFDGLCPNQFSTSFQNGCIVKFNMATQTLSVVHPLDCDIVSEGASPWCQLVETSPGVLYGTTLTGGTTQTGDGGILFEYNFIADTFTKKIDFNSAITGGIPNTLLNSGDGKLYGLCEVGGAEQECNPSLRFGTLFEYTLATNSFLVKQHFSYCGNSVKYPTSLILTSEGHLMGTFPLGGLFRWDATLNQIIMPDYSNVNPDIPNAYNSANLIEVCRKPSYHFFDETAFSPCLNSPFLYDIGNTNATSYLWKKNGQPLPSQTTGILTLPNVSESDNGEYTCEMTNECGTTVTMPLQINAGCLGIDEMEVDKAQITLHPNPANDQLNIRLPEGSSLKIIRCSIHNMLGQTVYESHAHNLRISTTHLASGLYNVVLMTNKGNWLGKFIRQ